MASTKAAFAALATCALLAGCGGKPEYVQPTGYIGVDPFYVSKLQPELVTAVKAKDQLAVTSPLACLHIIEAEADARCVNKAGQEVLRSVQGRILIPLNRYNQALYR